MSEQRTVTCDACGKIEPCEQYGARPKAWSFVYAVRFYKDFNGEHREQVTKDVCSDACHAKMLDQERDKLKVPPRNWDEEAKKRIRALDEAILGHMRDMADMKAAHAKEIDGWHLRVNDVQDQLAEAERKISSLHQKNIDLQQKNSDLWRRLSEEPGQT